MSDLEKARQQFTDAGLAFPTIPDELAVSLKELSKWVYSTCDLTNSPYMLEHFVQEYDLGRAEPYAVLAHSGYGINSYAIQYYLVSGHLGMFLHLGWGGVYMNGAEAAGQIGVCFSLADQIVVAAKRIERVRPGTRMTIVGTDFYQSYWTVTGQSGHRQRSEAMGPGQVLADVLAWLKHLPPY